MRDSTRERLFEAIQAACWEGVNVDALITECEEAWMEVLRQKAESDQHAWVKVRERRL
jgi:hypothetical protein